MINKNTLWLLLVIALSIVTFACKSDPKPEQEETEIETTIIDLEDQLEITDKLLLDKNGKLNYEQAQKYVIYATTFTKNNKDTSKVIKYAHQGAEVAKNIKDFGGAIDIYNVLARRFEENPTIIANALFAKAYILENNLKEEKQAKELYEAILKKYPETEISKSIPDVINAIGKTEAQLLDMIKSKNK